MGSFDVAADHAAITGAIAVGTDHVRARILSVWISYK
jgi:hypothetical protein